MKRLPWLVIVAMLLVFSGCMNVKLKRDLVLDHQDWTMEGSNSLRQHHASVHIDPPLEERWRYDVGAGVGPGGALIVDQVVLVGNREGQVHAVDLEDGKRIGRIKVGAPVDGSMAISENRLFVPLNLDKRAVIGYDLKSGDKLWAVKGAPVEAGLVVVDENVFVADTESSVYALDAASGEEVWRIWLNEGTGVVAPLMVAGNRLIAIDEEGTVYALDMASGEEFWTHELTYPVYNAASSSDDLLFIPTTRGKLIVLDIATGDLVWDYTEPDSTIRFTSPAYAPETGMLVFGGTDGMIRALDAGSGEEIWRTLVHGATIAAPLLSAQTAYVSTLRGGKLYALDTQTGSIVWTHELEGRIKSAMATQDGKIIVMAETQQVIMLAPEILEEEEI